MLDKHGIRYNQAQSSVDDLSCNHNDMGAVEMIKVDDGTLRVIITIKNISPEFATILSLTYSPNMTMIPVQDFPV